MSIESNHCIYHSQDSRENVDVKKKLAFYLRLSPWSYPVCHWWTFKCISRRKKSIFFLFFLIELIVCGIERTTRFTWRRILMEHFLSCRDDMVVAVLTLHRWIKQTMKWFIDKYSFLAGTPIQQFYTKKSVFMTGATGFLGKGSYQHSLENYQLSEGN